MEIYEPAEDSYLLARNIKKVLKKNQSFLDIGCGSGIQCEEALKITPKVRGVDSNPNAIAHCKQSEYTKGAEFLQSDLFQNLTDEIYDCITFNAPYLPDEKDPEDIKAYTTGGKEGYEIIERLLPKLNQHLAEEGSFLLLFSSYTNKEKVDELIKKFGFECRLLEEESLFFEKLYCYQITKSAFLKDCNNHNLTHISFFKRGTRGEIYKAQHEGKEVVIKRSIRGHLLTIEKEAKWLQRMNELGIGPQFHFVTKEFVVLEYLDGKEIKDYLAGATKDQKREALLKVFDQMHILDQEGLTKFEMIRPLKHIIVRDHVPYLIDFERMRYTEKPKNVTQFLQFLISGHLKEFFTLDQEEVSVIAKAYAQGGSYETVREFVSEKLKEK